MRGIINISSLQEWAIFIVYTPSKQVKMYTNGFSSPLLDLAALPKNTIYDLNLTRLYLPPVHFYAHFPVSCCLLSPEYK